MKERENNYVYVLSYYNECDGQENGVESVHLTEQGADARKEKCISEGEDHYDYLVEKKIILG